MNNQTHAEPTFADTGRTIKSNYGSTSITHRKRRLFPKLPIISARDAIILKEMLNTDGRISSITLSRKTGLPLTSVQRRRKHIEGMLIKTTHTPEYRAFGLHEIEVDIKTEGGLSSHVISELRELQNIVHLSRMHGDNRVSIRIRIVTESNLELIHCLDQIEAIEGVREIGWSEIIEEIPHRVDFIQLLDLSQVLEQGNLSASNDDLEDLDEQILQIP